MKKIALMLALGAVTMTAQAQFYVSATGGYALGIPSSKIGEENTEGNEKINFGTFGEGFNTQLRLGYFFNKTWGIDLSGGYLHGADQNIRREISTKTSPFPAKVDGQVKARGRAFGVALSVIYNFTDNFYGRFGVLTKVGGKTQALASSTTSTMMALPAGALATYGVPLPSGVNPSDIINVGSRIETSYTEDFKGKMPFGTIAALGYKYNIGKNVSIFAEIEYMNIGVVRDYSELKSFEQTLYAEIGSTTHTIPLKNLNQFTNGVYEDKIRDQIYYSKTTYVEERSANETDKSKKLTEKASYSSLGLNFGVTYSF